MTLNKLLLTSEIIGDDYNYNCWHLKGPAYFLLVISYILLMTLLLILCLEAKEVLLVTLPIGLTVVYGTLFMLNDDDDCSFPVYMVISVALMFIIKSLLEGTH